MLGDDLKITAKFFKFFIDNSGNVCYKFNIRVLKHVLILFYGGNK